MTTLENTKAEFRFTGWHMLACMGAFFGTIIVVNLFMATMASGTWTGLVVKNSYVASQKFNGQLQAAKAQAASGLRSEIAHTANVLTFKISDKDNAIIKPAEATVWIGRPAFEQSDKTIPAHCDTDGLCSAAIELQPGPWAVRIEAQLTDTTYRRDARLYVQPDGKVKVK